MFKFVLCWLITSFLHSGYQKPANQHPAKTYILSGFHKPASGKTSMYSKRVRGCVYISCKGGGLDSPHQLIFQVNHPDPRVVRGVESNGGGGARGRGKNELSYFDLYHHVGIKCGVFNCGDSKSG